MKTEEILENSGLLLKYTVYKNLGDILYSIEDHEKALDNYLEVCYFLLLSYVNVVDGDDGLSLPKIIKLASQGHIYF